VSLLFLIILAVSQKFYYHILRKSSPGNTSARKRILYITLWKNFGIFRFFSLTANSQSLLRIVCSLLWHKLIIVSITNYNHLPAAANQQTVLIKLNFKHKAPSIDIQSFQGRAHFQGNHFEYYRFLQSCTHFWPSILPQASQRKHFSRVFEVNSKK